ncbi:hypothetical protein SAMN02745134_02533 [Clostridium acidisoli DSM 12555]|uniref:Uncharacterized protein n=1 Tax=Clostridium acidisoli DSM 12555 TaxID=1121291 RepID=A0A1W1XNW7_9CLOT|nr:hypothetical protein [Clostridium acidisoli]SMC25680.1 hypothetical protein SAMN02745134_02533 [Clostridium acidisoli DSM 12555]
MAFTDFLGGSGKGSNLIVWVLILVVVFGFGKGKKFYNFNFKTEEAKKDKEDLKETETIHHGHRQKKVKVSSEKIFENMSFGNIAGNKTGFKKLVGGNGIFILVIVALLFICKDGKKHTSEEA